MKLDEVVQKLQQNPNIARIKKLIYFTCYGTWESDTQIIGNITTRELVESLLSLNLSIPELRIVLNNIVQKLNKSHEYSKVANAIVSEIVKLYPDEEDSTHPMLMYDPMEDATKPESPLEVEQLFAGESKGADGADRADGADGADGADRKAVPEKDEWFDVRMKLIQKTTPLRAKILIFSALYHEFSFGERDWSLLKKKGLADLLRKLSLACPNIEELEKKLAIPAKKLPGSSDYLQAAKAIAKYMSPYYEKDEDGLEQMAEEELRESRQEPVPAGSERYELAIGHDTQSSQISPVHPRDANNNENSQSWRNNENSKSWSIPTVPVPQLANNTELDSRSRSPVAEDSTYLDEASTTNSRLSSSGSGRRLKITDVLKQKRELEADIQALVGQSVDPVMTIIENTLTDLEKVLDDRLQEEQIRDRISRKYKALKDWVGIAGDALAKYMEVLNQMEQSDIEDLSSGAKAEAEPPEPKTNGNSKPYSQVNSQANSQANSQVNSQAEEKADTTPIVDTDRQQKIMELAKQGNPKAIAALLNQSLKSRGMTAIALLKEEFLHIILESDQEPNRQKTAKFASKTLRELNLTSITAAKVHWRKPGKKSPDWSQELEISPIE